MNVRAQRLGLGASTFSVSPFAAGMDRRKNLGQTEQLLYSRAKTAVSEFDVLRSQAEGVLSVPNLSRLLPVETRDQVDALVRSAEASSPTNYSVVSGSENLVQDLENANRSLKAAIDQAVKASAAARQETPAEEIFPRELLMPIGVLLIAGALIWYKS